MTDAPTKRKGGIRPGAGRPCKLSFRQGDVLVLETRAACGINNEAVTVAEITPMGEEVKLNVYRGGMPGDSYILRYPKPGELRVVIEIEGEKP